MSKRNKDKIKNQNRHPNRSYGVMKKLPDDIKEAVNDMLQSNYKYADIAAFIYENIGITVDKATISRYARQLEISLHEVRMAQENMRVMMKEINRYPDQDNTEVIVRLLCNRVLDAINNTPVEQWKDIDPIQLLDKASRLLRVVTQKKDVDIKIKSIKDIAVDGYIELFTEAMEEKDPNLYKAVLSFIQKEKEAESK